MNKPMKCIYCDYSVNWNEQELRWLHEQITEGFGPRWDYAPCDGLDGEIHADVEFPQRRLV